VGPVLSVSLFWEARLRHHRFPYPGVRNLTGKLRWQIWPKLRAKSPARE
jgi:acyl-CoA-binding protein